MAKQQNECLRLMCGRLNLRIACNPDPTSAFLYCDILWQGKYLRFLYYTLFAFLVAVRHAFAAWFLFSCYRCGLWMCLPSGLRVGSKMSMQI